MRFTKGIVVFCIAYLVIITGVSVYFSWAGKQFDFTLEQNFKVFGIELLILAFIKVTEMITEAKKKKSE